jgi:hypothetical protein
LGQTGIAPHAGNEAIVRRVVGRRFLMYLALTDLFRARWTDAIHEEIIMHLLDVAPEVVCGAANQQRESLKNPPMTVDEFLASLERQGLAQSVATLRTFADLI